MNIFIFFFSSLFTISFFSHSNVVNAPLGFQAPASIWLSTIIDYQEYIIIVFVLFIFLLVNLKFVWYFLTRLVAFFSNKQLDIINYNKYVRFLIGTFIFISAISFFFFHLHDPFILTFLFFSVFYIFTTVWFKCGQGNEKQYVTYLVLLVLLSLTFVLFRAVCVGIVSLFFTGVALSFVQIGFLLLLAILTYGGIFTFVFFIFPTFVSKCIITFYNKVVIGSKVQKFLFFTGLFLSICIRYIIFSTFVYNVDFSVMCSIASFVVPSKIPLPFSGFIIECVKDIKSTLFFLFSENQSDFLFAEKSDVVNSQKEKTLKELLLQPLQMISNGSKRFAGAGVSKGSGMVETKRTFIGRYSWEAAKSLSKDTKAPVYHYFYQPGKFLKDGYAMPLTHGKKNPEKFQWIAATDVHKTGQPQRASFDKFPIQAKDIHLIEQRPEGKVFESQHTQILDEAFNNAIPKTTPYKKAASGFKNT